MSGLRHLFRLFALGMVAVVAEGIAQDALPSPSGIQSPPSIPSQQPQGQDGGAQPQIGPVDLCQYRSPFIQAMKLPDDARLSTATPGIVGFTILALDPKTRRIRPLLHPTWKSAGQLGQFTHDGEGNIYVVPVPLTSLELNPPEKQNKVHVIDGQTGRLREFIDLPTERPVTTSNPFGAIGLAYDCETGSLYVASLAGSTPGEELGTIFRIDVRTASVADRLDGFDALGVGIFRGLDGKRIYLGSARRGEVVSVALDGRGGFVGEPRRELDLADLGLPRTYRAQKLRFDRQERMSLKAVPFAYSLRIIGPDETRFHTLRYLRGGGWEPESAHAVSDMAKEPMTEMPLD